MISKFSNNLQSRDKRPSESLGWTLPSKSQVENPKQIKYLDLNTKFKATFAQVNTFSH
jgi:hypothetical protein